MNRVSLTDAQLEELMSALEEAEDPEALNRGLAGDLCKISHYFATDSEVFRSYSTGFFERAKESVTWWALGASGLYDLNHLRHLQLVRTDIKASENDSLPGMLDEMQAVESRFETVPFAYGLAHSLLPAAPRAAELHVESFALLRTARTALAVERYRLGNGRIPDGLAELVPEYLPELPQDPFDGNPIRYGKLENGYVVYSIGPDRKDDGGAEVPAGWQELWRQRGTRSPREPPPPDVTFTVER